MGNLRQKYTDEEWDALVEESKTKQNSWVTWEYYIFILGFRLHDYAYTPKQVFDNIDYFKKCWQNKLSQYKALEFFSFELDDKRNE